MRHGSLFSGIGGFDLAAEWMGWENVFHCEWMPFPRQVLHYHFPNSISYEDITKTDFTIHRGTIDILTGGFPCQPYSSAGKRLGKEDERHLWPHMLRSIQEIAPTYVVGENVRGLTNWNGGVVFEEVCADLENCGYEVQPILLPACSVGAPHRRDRIWFVAYSKLRSNRLQAERWLGMDGTLLERCEWTKETNRFNINSNNERTTSNTKCEGLYGLYKTWQKNNIHRESSKIWGTTSRYNKKNDSNGITTNSNGSGLERRIKKTQNKFTINGNTWDIFPTQSPICGGDDGLPTQLDGITFSKWRQESIKGYGNAIVPQVAYEIFKVIQQLDGNTISR